MPHIRHQDGTLYKPDLVVFRCPNRAVVCDAQVSWETNEPMAKVWTRNRLLYNNIKFRQAAQKKWTIFVPCIVRARGIRPECNKLTEDAFTIKRQE